MSQWTKDYWNNRYASGGNSGYGSYNETLGRKLGWLKGLAIQSISEIGCGDFNLGKNVLAMYPKVTYVGQDISEVIVERNAKNYPDHKFTTDLNELPSADLVLCIDVMLHLIEESEVEELLKELDKRWTKYLAITAYERDEELDTHVRIRQFDYKRFGEPIIRQVSEDNGEMWFYLYKK